MAPTEREEREHWGGSCCAHVLHRSDHICWVFRNFSCQKQNRQVTVRERGGKHIFVEVIFYLF